MQIELNVAGVTFEGRQQIIGSLAQKASSHRAALVKEDDNPHDSSAVAVVVAGQKVGYVPKDYSRELRSCMGDILSTRFRPYYSQNLGCYCGTVTMNFADEE